MKHKLLPLLFASLLSLSTAFAQTDSEAYEVTGNMPVFYQQMKQQLTYPPGMGKGGRKRLCEMESTGTPRTGRMHTEPSTRPQGVCHGSDRP